MRVNDPPAVNSVFKIEIGGNGRARERLPTFLKAILALHYNVPQQLTGEPAFIQVAGRD
jgi:hypothetical protein